MIPNWTFIVIIMYFKYKPYKVRLIKKKKKSLDTQCNFKDVFNLWITATLRQPVKNVVLISFMLLLHVFLSLKAIDVVKKK